MDFYNYFVPNTTGNFATPNSQPPLMPPRCDQLVWLPTPQSPQPRSIPRAYSGQRNAASYPAPSHPCSMHSRAPPVASAMPTCNVSRTAAYSVAQPGPAELPKSVRLDLSPPGPPLAYTPAKPLQWADSQAAYLSDTAGYSPDMSLRSSPASALEEFYSELEESISNSSSSGISACNSLAPSPLPNVATPVKEDSRQVKLPSPSAPQAVSSPPDAEDVSQSKPQRRLRRDDLRVAPGAVGTGSLTVTNSQPPEYICDICSAVFVRKHDGERHRRSHTGERPFPCHGGCGKAFRRADARSRHWGVYRQCEWQHSLFLQGTPEGARRERRLLKRAKREELVKQGVARPQIERILKKM